MLVDVNVYFSQRIVYADVIGESLHNIDALGVIDGKARTRTSHRCGSASAPLTLQPEISRLAGLTATPLARRSSIAFGMLPPQSPFTNGEMQFPAAGNDTVEGVVTL